MIRKTWLWLLVAVIAGAVACRDAGVKKEESAAEAAGEESPLLLEDEEPLLLEEPGAEDSAETGPLADNSRCFVCHINFSEEELAVRHARADVGCERCHGPSYAHCSDEDNITPPDIMFAKEKINPACRHCHQELTDTHKAVVDGTAKEKKYCTDCHGKHLLVHRTRRWDKATRRLIEDDKVRMMTDDLLKKNE